MADRQKVGELLKKYTSAEVYEVVKRRIPLGRLQAWKRKITAGIDIAKPKVKPPNSVFRREWPELENALFSWFREQRDMHMPIRTKDLQIKAVELQDLVYYFPLFDFGIFQMDQLKNGSGNNEGSAKFCHKCDKRIELARTI